MKTVIHLCIVAGALGMITSCALPPRDAMRIVQRDGLISYLSHDYSHYTHAAPASASPLRVSPVPYTTPRPVASVPYRSTYHTNRYARAEYDRVPYRPKNSSTHSKSSSAAAARKRVVTNASPSPRSSVSSTASVKEKTNADSASTNSNAAPEPPKKSAEALPYGSPVAGRPGMVTSPFAQKQQLVDVTGMAPGDTVKDPYSGKLFRVPPSQQASAASPAAAKPNAAPPKESPKASSEAPSPPAEPSASEPKPSTPEAAKP